MGIFTVFRSVGHFFAVALLLLSLNSRGQTAHYNFYNHSTDNGLLTNDYQRIFHDSYGFVWLASFDGLFRWDGYTLKKYLHREKDSLSLDNNIVYSIFEDSQRRLWVGTIDGLNLYDVAHDHFHRMPLNGQKSKTPVNAILEDDVHRLWLGTSSGIARYDAQARRAEWFRVPGDDDNIIFCLALDRRHQLWAGTYNKGVMAFHTDTHRFRFFRNTAEQATLLASNKIQCMLITDDQRIWVGTEDRGVSVLDSSGRPIAAFDHLTYSDHSAHSNIRCLYQDTHGDIWIGIGREVVCQVKKGSLQPVPVTTRAQNNGQERLNSITSIAEDTFGNIWFASSGYGLFTTNSRKNVFNNLLTSTAALPGLNTTVIAAGYEDARHRLWVGTAGSGVVLLDPARPDKAIPTPLYGSLAVNDVKGDAQGRIWVACWTNGLKCYDPASGQLHNYLHDAQDPYSLPNNDVKAVLPDDSLVWIGTQGDGIAALNTRTQQFTHYKNNHTFPFNMQAPGWVNHLFKDHAKRLWISTYSGLFLYDGAALHAYEHTENAASINSNSVNMVTEDAQGRIWVVTEQGLDRFEPGTQTFTHLNKQLPLPESMKSIVCDAAGNLWIGTNEGLLHLHPGTLQLTRYDKNDGLFERTFFQKAVWRGYDGTLYFGGPKGLSAFNPAHILPEQTPAYFYFTDLTIFGDVQQPGQPGSALQRILNLTDTLRLTQKQSFFSIGFAAIN
ncbi:MAG TPA: two-component regulator propeller domain-containing protein, partial [Chitinophaga sp.]